MGGRKMASLKSEIGPWVPELGRDLRHPLAWRRPRRDSHATLLVAGAFAVGLGLLTWHYLGPDVKRYLKMHSM